jgi:TolB-like protein/Flp pilus assembly protein TadD
MPELDENPPDRGGKPKKKDRVRSVWISFIGRIVAQIIGAIASVVLGIFILQRYQDSPAPPPAAAPAPRPHGEQAIAVLPLDNFSPDPADAYFARGMTEVLISDLAQIKGWRVISRTSTEAYRDTAKSIAQIGTELNVDLIVEGSVTKAGEQVRVVIQLIETKSDEHLWARTYDRSRRDVLALQSELAREIAKSLKAAINPEHEVRLATRAAFDPAVYDLYLRGRHAWNLRTPEGLASAVKLFSEAAAQEPNFALAQVGLADAYSLGGAPSSGPRDARDRTAKARAAAERAISIAGYMAESHTSMGGVLFFGDRDAAAAERSFRRAIELNPNYPIAHQWLAILLAERRRDDDARRHAETAVKLDPMEATFHQAAGLVHYYGGRYGDAVAAERRALEIRPQLPFARVVLIKSLVMSGDAPAAVRACDDVTAAASSNVELVLTCGIALHRAGDGRAAALGQRLERMRPEPISAIMQWHAATGGLTRAFEMMAALRAANNLPPNLAFDPLFEPLRNDDRYAKLLR